jgi:xylulokinase
MTARQGLIGIDIGTSATKVLVIDGTGAILARHTAGYPLSTPRPGWAEQDPADWWRAVRDGVRAVVAEIGPDVTLAGIGLSGQMHGLVPLDAADRVIRPAILWNDQRTGRQCAWITERAGGLDGLLALTNNPMLTGYTGGKIVWLRDEEPAHYERLARFLNPKDHIRLLLTGEHATDVSEGSGTGLFDVKNRRWSTDLLARLDIPLSMVPRAVESHEVTGTLLDSVADDLGLPRGLPVVGGGGDGVIQTTGSGLVDPGIAQTIIGTAGIAACALDSCAANPGGRLQVFCNNAPGRWHCMGVSMNAGGSFAWLRQTLTAFSDGEVGFDGMTALAETVPPGAEGLLFLPYLIGERCPHPDPDARGAFVGLTLRHGTGHLIRAAMEGVVFSMREMLELMKPLGLEAHTIRASGGGAASPLWRQIQADALGAEIEIVKGAAEGGALGAALVAGVGTGVWPDLQTAVQDIAVESRTPPNPATRAAYDAAFEVYRELYPTLKPRFDQLARTAGIWGG